MEQKEVQLLIVLVSVAFFILLVFFIGLITYLRGRKAQFLLEKERDHLRFQEQLLLTEAEITEENLKNVSWELHDNIGQLLSIASIEMGMLMQEESIQTKDLTEIKSLVKQSIEQLRSLSKTLNTDVIQTMGLIAMINIEVERLNRLRLIDASFHHPDTLTVDSQHEVIVFRMIQEFINNTLKHAEAEQLLIRIEEKEHRYCIQVRDTGKGFDKDAVNVSSGLINFEKRANLIGGQLTFNSTPGQGTEMILWIG